MRHVEERRGKHFRSEKYRRFSILQRRDSYPEPEQTHLKAVGISKRISRRLYSRRFVANSRNSGQIIRRFLKKPCVLSGPQREDAPLKISLSVDVSLRDVCLLSKNNLTDNCVYTIRFI